MKHPSFHTKDGRLTPYALACGYIERYDSKPNEELAGQSVVLYREHGTLHVRQFDHDGGKRAFWDCPDTLTAARKRFDLAKKAIRG